MPEPLGALAHFQDQFLETIARPLPPRSPLAVYRNTVLLGAIEALGDNYPVTRAIVDDETFAAIAQDFVADNPPQSPVLARYGAAFADWLDGHPLGRELAYLADVARCELLWCEALHAPDAPALTLDQLDLAAPEELLALRLRLHPAARFGWFATPAAEIWLAHQGDTPAEIAPTWTSAGALFTRPGLQVRGMALDPAAHRVLCGIRIGERLGEAAAAAARLYPDTNPGSSFAALVQHGAFAAPIR